MSTGIWSGMASTCPASTPNPARWRRDPLIPALAGALLVAGLIGIVAGLRRTPQPPPAPQRTRVRVPGWLRSVRPRTRILILVGFGVGVLVALLTGWLVAALLVPAAVAGLPVLLSPRRRRRRSTGWRRWRSGPAPCRGC